MKRYAAARGFTLVEVLVALTVMAVLMTGLFGVLRFSARSWEVGTLRAEQVEDLQVVHGFLRRSLSSMVDPVTATEEKELFMGGDAQRLRFVSTLPAEIGLGGLYVFELYLSDGSPGNLVLDWYVYRPEGVYPPVDPEEQGRVLLSGLEILQFQYLVPYGSDEALIWSDQWQAVRGMPQAVRVDIGFADRDPRRWPGLIALPYSANR